MTVVYRMGQEYFSVTKGAFDRLHLVNPSEHYQAEHDQLADQAYRVLGVAYKVFQQPIEELSEEELGVEICRLYRHYRSSEERSSKGSGNSQKSRDQNRYDHWRSFINSFTYC